MKRFEDDGAMSIVNDVTGSETSVPGPDHALEDQLDAAFSCSEPDRWHAPVYLEPTQPHVD